jgi:hypothetical protein
MNTVCISAKTLTLIDIQSDQQETKSRVLPHLMFYRNVCLILTRHFYILAVHNRFVGCLPQKSIIDFLYKIFIIHE